MSAHISSLVIDGLAAGHLRGDEAARARIHIEACARCRGDLEAAEAACSTFTREVLPRTIGRLRRRPPWWRALRPALLVPVLAAAALLIWFVRKPADAPPEADIRVKGAMTFKVFAKRGDEVIPVRDGRMLAAGDQIRFVVGSSGPRFLLVASVDGAGNTTVYFPYGGARSAVIGKEPSELPGSIVLDRAPGPERVFALFSNEPLDATVVTRALATIGARGAAAIRSTAVLDVPAANQATVVFEKAVP